MYFILESENQKFVNVSVICDKLFQIIGTEELTLAWGNHSSDDYIKNPL